MLKRVGVMAAVVLVASGLLGAPAAEAKPGDPGEPIELSSGLPEGIGVSDPALSPDGRHVVHLADDFVAMQRRLWSVPTAGGQPVELTRPAQLAGGGVVGFEIAADSSAVVFAARPRAGVRGAELFSVPIGGGNPTQLTAALDFGAEVTEFQLTPDSARVVYSIRTLDLRNILFVVPVGGGPALRLSEDIASAYSRPVGITEDSRRLVYVDTQDRLWSAPVVGGSPTRLTGAGERVFFGPMFLKDVAAPAGDRVVFLSDPDGDGRPTLFSVLATGGGRLELLAPSEGVDLERFVISPDDTQAVVTLFPSYQLATVPVDGGAAVTFAPTLAVPDVWLPTFSPGSQWLVFTTRTDTGAALWLAPTDGSGPARLVGRFDGVSAPEFIGEDVMVVSGGGALFAVSTTSGELRPIRNGFPASAFLVSPDGERIVYSYFDFLRLEGGLYSIAFGGGTDIALSDAGDPDQLTTPWFAASEDRVLFHGRGWEAGFPGSLFAVRPSWPCRGRWATHAGTNRPDELNGTRRADVIVGRGGDDTIDGGGGKDLICGAGGSDTLHGGRGRDLLDGGAARDECLGGPGRDALRRCELGD